MSEFLDNTKDKGLKDKQDCELKAFYRLTQKIKKEFPHLKIMLLLDGLYAKGPVMDICKKYHWDFMIVHKRDCLKSIWEEVEGLKKLQVDQQKQKIWADRTQNFTWVN